MMKEDDMDKTTQSVFDELKHSIRTHLLIMAGPTQQLCSFMIKLIDFMEDSDSERKRQEMATLSYNIIEGLALYVQRSMDERAEKAKTTGHPFPPNVQQASDDILVIVGKTRSLDDKISAKYVVLKTMSQALKALSTYTKAQYPQFTDASGNIL